MENDAPEGYEYWMPPGCTEPQLRPIQGDVERVAESAEPAAEVVEEPADDGAVEIA